MTGWRLRFEPAISPLFRAWWRMRRPMTLGVRGVACDEAGRVLMVRHTYAPGWHLPGGGVERGETAVAAIVREMAEEAGVEAIGAPLLVGFYANHANFPNDHIALYRIQSWRPCAWQANREIAERVRLPEPLASRWFNRGYYGTMMHNSRAVYQRYMGWYDGNPANLNPLPPVVAPEEADILLAFGVSERGQVRDLERVDDKALESRQASRLIRLLRKTPFRPKFEAGQPVETEKIVKAFTVR